MGTENAVTKEYLKDPERFAEVFNNEVFEGRQVIQPQKLRELDPEELAVIVETHKELKYLDQYRGGLKALLGFVKYQKDKDALLGFLGGNEQVFRQLDAETSRAIRGLVNAKELETILIRQEAETEEIDMCQALDDWKKEIMADTLDKGIEALILDNLEEGRSREQITLKLEKRFSLNTEAANQYYEKFAR